MKKKLSSKKIAEDLAKLLNLPEDNTKHIYLFKSKQDALKYIYGGLDR